MCVVCGAVLGVAGVVLIVRYGSSDYQCVTEDSGSSQVIVIPTIQHTRIESTNPCNVKMLCNNVLRVARIILFYSS